MSALGLTVRYVDSERERRSVHRSRSDDKNDMCFCAGAVDAAVVYNKSSQSRVTAQGCAEA